MIHNKFKNINLSRLGFGTMRLPMNSDGSINQELTEQMVDLAITSGVNYFDTAYPYHNGYSEIVIGKALKKYPRNSYFLATKYPGHQTASSYNPEEIFEKQLKKCDVDYFDFYLLHNVNEGSFKVYTDKKWNIIDYFLKQKELGRIKYLGFSTHADIPCLKEFLDLYAKDMEFCQIQFNYVDASLQHAKEKYDLITSYNIPVWVMEPVRGGKLALMEEEYSKKLKEFNSNDSIASWAFKYLLQFENVKMILSGMSNMEQMQDNIQTFNNYKGITKEENDYLNELGRKLIKGVPCTKCEYCVAGCPKKLNIPKLLSTYNDMKYTFSFTPTMYLENLSDDERPSACISCYKCARTCPQKIDIPKALKELSQMYEKNPKWKDICIEREKQAKALK